MRIKSIRLHHIRSYRDQTIEFPEGIVLLSGDIGSGKSSILLGIEFALFGLLRGTTSGSTLLTHGERSGFVTLVLHIGEQEVAITRTLKRKAQAILQDAGSISINGRQKELTPSEMKASIFEMLGYPASLMNTSKGLLYRYTLFTPQEAMKQILEERQEMRLDVLRKLFNIDKYKTIKKNISTFARQSRERLRFLEEQCRSIPHLEEQQKECRVNQEQTQQKITTLQPALALIQKQVQEAKELVQALDTKRLQHVQLEKKQQHLSATIQAKRQECARMEQEKVQLLNVVHETREEPLTETAESIFQDQQHLLKELRAAQNTITQHTLKKGRIAGKIDEQKGKVARLDQLGECPTCFQIVTENHKQTIHNTAVNNIQEVQAAIVEIEEIVRKQESKQGIIQEQLKQLTALQQKIAERDRKKALKQAQQTRIQTIQELLTTFANDIADLEMQHTQLAAEVSNVHVNQQEYLHIKTNFDALMQEERRQAIALASLQEQLKSAEQLANNLAKQLQEKYTLQKEGKSLKHHTRWVAEVLIPILDQSEIHVFSSLHRQFNELFSDWFLTLVDDEAFSVRLDETFSPVIQVQGHDMDYGQLSGGERTAVALAYRLALNTVINSMIDTIKTKDVLILDEPTDGFSSSQLDRVRDVLNRLQLKQIIIVSHERKIEGFVEHIIRVTKENTKSKITMHA